MKTKNNVQKTLLRWAAVLISFVLISFTVSAQDFWKRLLENSSFGNIAMAMVDTKDLPVEIAYEMPAITEERESELTLESWMTDESTFSRTAMSVETENELNLLPESWMFDENVFLPAYDAEPELQLESWMVSEQVWKI